MELIKDKIGRQRQTFYPPPDRVSTRLIAASIIILITILTGTISGALTSRDNHAERSDHGRRPITGFCVTPLVINHGEGVITWALTLTPPRLIPSRDDTPQHPPGVSHPGSAWPNHMVG
ncbi:hypothetical protein EDWATA_01400 [Edwardsiella tarda ATCC 23685]|uniref:Uncharacterized protein n=1 Tax=Edwardsiella tarda ATCC 23685 TaxID=500638 RepID=D4F3T5_EDWTA|nr:hypothetical protein EDWATA_01400 [Edwardsiella tarda ATCC 23685]